MTPQLLRSLAQLVERIRPTFFTPQEWVVQLCTGLLWVPIGSPLMFGPNYLRDPWVFLVGTLAALPAYGLGIVTQTLMIRRIMARFPHYQQSLRRALLMIGVLSAYCLVCNYFTYYAVCHISFFKAYFDWQSMKLMWTICLVGVISFCIVFNALYAYQQWQNELLAVESLRSQQLQHQFDALKQQVNPHFLFNSFSAISSLVGEDPQQAERFVDGLARVYRYLLRASNRPLVGVQEELEFMRTYTELLQVRYGASLCIRLPPAPVSLAAWVPSLSLQLLVDNAIKHNRMSVAQPLVIELHLDEQGVRVINTLQRKTRRLALTSGQGLAALQERYRSLTHVPVQIAEEGPLFSVTIPFLELAEP